MKTWQEGTALHIAVFLLIFVTGCYTTLRSPAHLEYSAVTESQYQQADWDFGCGWYYNEINVGTNYFYYHSMPWWYNVRPEPAAPESPSNSGEQGQSGGGKIVRRDNDTPYQGNAALPLQPNISRDSTAISSHQVVQDSAVTPPTNMTIDTKQDSSNTNRDNSSKDNSSGKVSRRGRR
jgi:hypothetical protein